MGLVAARCLGCSRTRDRTCDPWVGRWILNHWVTREVFLRGLDRPSLTFLLPTLMMRLIKTIGTCSYLILTVKDQDVSVAHILPRRLKCRIKSETQSRFEPRSSRPASPYSWVSCSPSCQPDKLGPEETLKDKISQGFGKQPTRQTTFETFSFPCEGRSWEKPKRNWDQRLAWEPEVSLYRGEGTKAKWEEVSLQLNSHLAVPTPAATSHGPIC